MEQEQLAAGAALAAWQDQERDRAERATVRGVAAATRQEARRRRAQEVAAGDVLPSLLPTFARAADGAARTQRLRALGGTAADVAQAAFADVWAAATGAEPSPAPNVAAVLTALTNGADPAPTIGRLARAVAERFAASLRREAPAGDATEVAGEERPAEGSAQEAARAAKESGDRQRRAVLARRGTIAGIHRADVYGVSEAAREAMRDPADVYANRRRVQYLTAAADAPFVPRRAAEARSWAALLASAEPSTAPYRRGWRVLSLVESPAVAESGDRVRGPWHPAQEARRTWTRTVATDVRTVAAATSPADVLFGAYSPMVLATYRTKTNRPGDVLQAARLSWANALPGSSTASRAALQRAARSWAAAVRSAGASWADQEAREQRERHRGRLLLRRAARVAPFGPYRWAAPDVPAAPRASLLPALGASLRPWAPSLSPDVAGYWQDQENAGKEARRWASLAAGKREHAWQEAANAVPYGRRTAPALLLLSADVLPWNAAPDSLPTLLPSAGRFAVNVAAAQESAAVALAEQYALQEARRIVRALLVLFYAGTSPLHAERLLRERRMTAR